MKNTKITPEPEISNNKREHNLEKYMQSKWFGFI